MQLTVLNCPLCKSPVEEPESAGSRLCERCQSLVQTILPQDAASDFVRTEAAQPLADTVDAYSTDWESTSGVLDTQPLVVDEELSGPPLLAEVRAAATGSLVDETPGAAATDDEYSSTHEWPLMVGAEHQKGGVFSNVSRFRLPILVAVLMSCGVAAYFLVYRPYLSAAQSETDSIRGAAHGRNGASGEAAGPPHTAQTAADSGRPAGERSGPANSGDGARNAADSSAAQGQIALQVASLPNLAAARAFSEKLVSAGIPSYVVAADLGRRGKWYRVRVGRFATHAEAQAYAAQSRQRARAAGISIELIVSEYEMPLTQD